MEYKALYRETNEAVAERFALVRERIAEIACTPEVPRKFAEYFRRNAAFLQRLAAVCEQAVQEDVLSKRSMEQCEEDNRAFYGDIVGEAYEKSYANPQYAVGLLGEGLGQGLCLLTAHFRSCIDKAFQGKMQLVTVAMELFVEIYNYFEREAEELPTAEEIRRSIYWYFHDYSEIFYEEKLRCCIDTREDFAVGIVMQSDLTDLRYLYRYGAHIGENELGMAAFLNTLPEDKIQAMADTYTEGYRIGFETTGKDLKKKSTVEIRYPIGFERVVRAAVVNFGKLNLRPTMRAESLPPNKQFLYDHREDRAFYLDKGYVERVLEVQHSYLETEKKRAAEYSGPAVIEVFGEEPFSPNNIAEALRYSEKQQKLDVYERSMSAQQKNRYIKGDETSFTIIAYPIPEIGPQFAEIFAETVKLNTLDYKLYQTVQQKMIDVLDTAERVRITGKGGNKTDLYVNIWKLRNPDKETAFENCVADVNIPVGEVFTSPVLNGTEGKLFVSQVYLNGLHYKNLELDFKDGMIEAYTCTNFPEEEKNKAYVKENLLKHHETLPMGEFAIGTNTTAYRMARTYQIADKLPILIAEKTGPHFAVGDTCYCHEEDNISYNPDGKAIVARENAISALRGEDMEKAYLNCHTDITIPYDELDKITVIRKDGTTEDIIAGGRFVLPGTEILNDPLDFACDEK